MKTLYEVLEVSENASQEVIEKVYRALAKKYHPDLQIDENKLDAEKKMKEINEAYGVIGDETKRKEYDNKLAQERQEEKQREEANRQAYNTQQRPMSEEEYKEAKRRQQEAIKQEQKMQEEMQARYQQQYQQDYEGYLRSLGYKIKHKWTWRNFRDFIITILIIIAIFVALWFFPPTNKFILDFYNSNPIIKTIVNIIGGILKGIWNGICSFFGGK